METIDTYLSSHSIPYQRLVSNDFIQYELKGDNDKRVKLQILRGINTNVGHYSIYVNERGSYINYEKYGNEKEFLKDVDNILRASVSLHSTIQGGRGIMNKYLFTYPGDVAIRPYQVVEYMEPSSLFMGKSHIEKLLQPWI